MKTRRVRCVAGLPFPHRFEQRHEDKLRQHRLVFRDVRQQRIHPHPPLPPKAGTWEKGEPNLSIHLLHPAESPSITLRSLHRGSVTAGRLGPVVLTFPTRALAQSLLRGLCGYQKRFRAKLHALLSPLLTTGFVTVAVTAFPSCCVI